MEPRVFIPQIAERFIPDTPEEQERRAQYDRDAGREPRSNGYGRLKPLFDFTPAAAFGQLTPVLEPRDNPMMIARISPRIAEVMESFNPETDYFIPVGDPAVIAICTGLILRRTSKFKMLKWDRHTRMYVTLEINV